MPILERLEKQMDANRRHASIQELKDIMMRLQSFLLLFKKCKLI